MPHRGTISKKSTPKTNSRNSKASKNTETTKSVSGHFAKLKTKREVSKQANKIIRGLNEAKEIKAGNKPKVTFDEFLSTF